MRFLVSVLLIVLFSFLTGRFLPWWSIALVCFVVALLIPQSTGRSFGAGFLGIFVMWGLLASWIDVQNNHILSQKIAQLLPLGGSSIMLILVTALIGALVGGLAALSGSSLRPVRR
jgi:hypothetical protein